MHAKSVEKYFDAEHLCLNEADISIAQGSLTNSKRIESFIAGVFPSHVVRGEQEYLYDFENRQYVDYLCGLGCNLFGYNNPDIVQAVIRAAVNGFSLSLNTPSSVELARRLKLKFPYIDKIKILKSGSEGCSASIRIARSFTHRSVVMSDGYHGWHDEFTSLTPPAWGVAPETNYQIQQIDPDDINQAVAAVIIEPVITDWSDERRMFLGRLRDSCTRNGTVLIFDETITAYRFPNYSVANFWGIEPDLTVMGKALANGMPISIVGGKRAIMESDYFVSSTYADERLTLEAAIVATDLITGKYNPSYLWEQGQLFIEKMNDALNPYIKLVGYPSRGAFSGDVLMRSLFIQEMCKAGFIFHPSTWFYNAHLHKHLDDVVGCSKIILQNILAGQVKLEGAPFKQPFKKQGH